ncbi:peptidoglycan-binding protein [Allonocardiopsis opalescens]|uniref:N-acetylmuramoyl-L-alanine amidase n=1 Tax=Allonocardiopsis opalescens TaxID=1144618 RepID=A0A2T0Q261_9ACTN|nr:peptidoglycan-binding protein [Allonocardiopsis opalescens]PRX97869.1 N-acetylmuramoyl-L-alanine amidase [Allonocardiopsis opalescens]
MILRPRSYFGWGPSGADYANPRSGLVVHYNGPATDLDGHDECVAYWKRIRSDHINGNGWADVGYCVDEETEILTAAGWRTFRQIEPGDPVLTLDHETGMSEWQPLLAVNVFPAMPRELVLMEGSGHSSLTTPNHRWPVERFYRKTGTERRHEADGTGAATGAAPLSVQGRERRWATTGTLTYRDRVPLAAPRADLPTEQKWSDALVELVAWFWTEGHIEPQSGSREASTGVTIYQPLVRNPADTDRIRAALHVLFGPPSDRFPRTGSGTDGAPRWREAHNRHSAEFHLSVDAGRVLLEHAPGRVPSHAFLLSLTKAQLELFIAVSLLGGGHNHRTNDSRALSRKDRSAAEAFQFAATVAGYATSLRRRPPTASTAYDMWKVELRRKSYFAPKPAAAAPRSAFSIGTRTYAGHIWCPTTPNATWLARRKGTVYFTGNSFSACRHGEVFTGRGLNRYQAAQGTTSGNANWYSVTLMLGGSERPTDEQVRGVRDLRAYLMDRGVAGAVRGHRDFIATECPGDVLYALVENGGFRGEGDGSVGGGEDPGEPGGDGIPAWPGVYLSQPPVRESDAARTWQRRMRDRGWTIVADGRYGPDSERVCRAFQAEKGLAVDGVVGPETWRAAWTAPVT